MSEWIILLVCLLYLSILFVIATWAEKRKLKGKSVIHQPIIYSLSLAVYCTAWTFYGSVGRAASNGAEFLAVYIGPTIMAAFFWPVLRKMVRISKELRITSLADFISTRYGKNFSLAIVVSLMAMIGIIPYIGLQIKSISSSLQIIMTEVNHTPASTTILGISITLILMLFTILYGARSVDTTEKHEGLVTVVAFESIVKLLALLVGGLFICYSVFNGPLDLFSTTSQAENAIQKFTMQGPSVYFGWTAMIILSGFAMVLLPRQFQIAVVENVHESHIRSAIWMLPLYLILITIFVLPIALGGSFLFAGSGVDADNYVLAIPLQQGNYWMAMITWIGGFSAASSMIVVEAIAISIMVSNNLVMPILVRNFSREQQPEGSFQQKILWVRRISIALVLILALVYSKTIGQRLTLVSIGLVSFCAVAQFAPALIGGMFWKDGNRNGAMAGMITGFLLWGYTLVLPGAFPDAHFVQHGPWGIAALKPYSLFGLSALDPIAHAMVWSLLANTFLYVTISMHTQAKSQERFQAALFVDVFSNNRISNNEIAWKGNARLKDIQHLLNNFLGEARSHNLLQAYAIRHSIQLDADGQADPRIVTFSERILGGVIGTASARILISNITKEEEINIDEVLNILRENQQTLEMNKELRKRSLELSKATKQLEQANTQLKLLDEQKDEFLYTVTHELRTPLTSIRALSEIVHDNPDLEEEQRQQYLTAITKETERLSHLITQVLTLEKYESGKYRLNLSAINLAEVLHHVINTMQPLAAEKGLQIQLRTAETQALLQADKELITQVCFNLIGNAIKFARQQITITLLSNYDEWQIRVSDDGKGIAQELQQLIFDKFFQARNQTLKKPEGSGLGLAICKEILELHNGQIFVESKPDEGATFICALPA